MLVNSPSFEGTNFSSQRGSLVITKEGELAKTNYLVLIDFLSFSKEEEIVFEKDISNGNASDYKVTLTPDAVFELAD